MKKIIKKILKLSPIPFTKNHLYDLLTKKIFAKVLKSNSNCVDVGCYKGEILDMLLSKAPNGQHFGIEPIPEMYAKLIVKYESATSQCKILNYAASFEKGVSSFNFVTSNPSYSGLRKRDYDRPNETDTSIQVKTELLDALIPDDLKIDLIKIDVEGAELFVLEGAKRIISSFKPYVIFEHGLGASEYYDSTPEKVFGYFSNMGMMVSNLGSFLKGKPSLSKEEFMKQYFERKEYYFIAHP